MTKYIYFNDQNVHWCNDYEANKYFIKANINYLRDFITYKGYIYLNKIYEIFGGVWDPHEPNVALIFNENEPLITYTHLKGADFRISVYYEVDT